MLKKIAIGAALAACAAFLPQVQVHAQRAGAPGRATGGQTTAAAGAAAYPTDEQWKDSKPAQALVAKARAAAGDDAYLKERFDKMCTALGPQNAGTLLRNAGKTPEPPHTIEPIKIFDNLYFLGLNTIGAWAIPTSQGIIMIDALNNPKEAETIIEPSLKKVGLNPADVKTIIVGHGHFDHFGGAPYFQQKYGTHVVMSKLDWDWLETPAGGRGAGPDRPLPKRDVEIATNGQKVTLGDETITLEITPGHTPGSMAYIIPVKDHGKPINVLMLSGANITPDQASVDAFKKALAAAKAAKAQVLINGHPDTLGFETRWIEELRANPNGPNHYEMTVPQFAKFADIMGDCAQARVTAMDYKGTN
jgi:metallo-beta-lactamase class B